MDEFVVRSMKEAERQECLDLWCTVWPGEESATYFRRYFYGDVEDLPYYTQVGLLNDKIVSAVHICKRTVACGDFQLTMGGIANVSTLPEYRQQGFNTRCLQSAIAIMEADAMDFSLLFTGINSYYARQGYATLPRPWLSGIVASSPKPLPEASVASLKSLDIAAASLYTVRQAVASDLEAIQRCYETYNRFRPIAVQRTPAYWRDWINIHPDHVPENLLIASDAESRVCGYVQTGVFKSAVAYSAEAVEARVIEFGIAEGMGDAEQKEIALALLQAVIATMGAGAARVLRVEVAQDAAMEYALNALLIETKKHESNYGMVRLLHRENLLRGLTMHFNDRWIAAGRPTGIITFATPYGTVALDAMGALLRILSEENSASGSTAEILPQATFFGLLFGMLSPDQATANAALYPLLAALFPPQASVYYGADGF